MSRRTSIATVFVFVAAAAATGMFVVLSRRGAARVEANSVPTSSQQANGASSIQELEARIAALESRPTSPASITSATSSSALPISESGGVGTLDPDTLKQQNQERHSSMIANHQRDARDSTWAPGVESNLRKELAGFGVDAGVREIDSMDCRMTTCLVEISLSRPLEPEIAGALVSADKLNTGCTHEVWGSREGHTLNLFLDCASAR